MFISTVKDTADKLFTVQWCATTPRTNESPVSTTPAINLFHGFSVIGGVIDQQCRDISDKFITGVIDTAEQLSPVTTTRAINLSLISSTLLNNIRQ
jgi:hypothetical protein